MAGYAYDLGPRQSDRIIEQSAQQHASIWAETIEQCQPRAFSGCLLACNSEIITLQLSSPSLDTYVPVTGQYYQILITLGDTRYLTVSDLLEVQKRLEGLVLVFSRPRSLQVMQRRKFHRHVPGKAFPVYISWQDNPAVSGSEKANHTPALGQIKDLSIHGMSIRAPNHLNDHLFIGDTVYLRFSLSVREPEYFSSATICHKELGKNPPELIIGLQFIGPEQNPDFQSRLQAALTQDIFSRDAGETRNAKDTNKGT
jgi:hypothetical protein